MGGTDAALSWRQMPRPGAFSARIYEHYGWRGNGAAFLLVSLFTLASTFCLISSDEDRSSFPPGAVVLCDRLEDPSSP